MADIVEIQHDSHLLVYADDIFLYNSGINWNKTIGEMQESLNKISGWCKKWKLSTSPEKSRLINFSRKRSKIPTLNKICDKPITEVKSLKILGIIFDPNISWKNHINYLRQKGFKYLNAIKALSSPKIETRSDHLLNIINATIRSIFDYGSQLFSFSSNSNRQKLEPIYNAALRLALGLTRNTPLDLLRAESMNEKKKRLVFLKKTINLLQELCISKVDILQWIPPPPIYENRKINIYTHELPFQNKDLPEDIHWCAKIKDEVEKLAYQLNEEAERTERPIRRLSKVMYGSTCADMHVDVMGECLSSIKHVVGVRSVFLAKRLHVV
ncbi:uncharacterized protein TNCV_3114581 [Trichonephila clavipes]|nr:uncharacterized protein TNCV_3114581 [Trichonephila clavipes]